MFNRRMLSIIHYLSINGEASYKELAEELEVSERSVRYDIDRINDILSVERLPEIEKLSKGVLKYPKNLELKGIEDGDHIIYNSEERIEIILLMLLIRPEDLKINQLSSQFQVSRSTIKNDMAALDKTLKKDGMCIGYSGHFYLSGPKLKRTTLMNQKFQKYIEYLINPYTKYNTYEFYCIHIIHKSFEGISIANVVIEVDNILDKLECTLTTKSYLWYLSSIIVLIWYITNDKEYPLDITIIPEFDSEIYHIFANNIEEIIGMPISEKHIVIMAKMLDFTNKFRGKSVEVDIVHAEAVTFSLIAEMSKRMNIHFDKDKILIENLLNHMIPLIQRIQNHIEIKDNVISASLR